MSNTSSLNEMRLIEIPKIVKEYKGNMYPYMSVTDGTQSYISDYLIAKDNERYVIVEIENEGIGDIEFVLPSNHTIYRNGNYNYSSIVSLKQRIVDWTLETMKTARQHGITRER